MSIDNNFIGRAAPLGLMDVSNAAVTLGVDTAHIGAVLAVETNGSGFDSRGRPKMLFEPHIFYQLLLGDQLRLAITKGLAYQRWGAMPYPPDSYQRLNEAMLINQTAALCSASWGLGQIMGGNFHLAGYNTVQGMVAAACDSESAQLSMLMRYIVNSKLVHYLVANDWVGFARAYNGPGQVAVYAAKLQSAFATLTANTKSTPLVRRPLVLVSDDLNGQELGRIQNTKTTTVV